MRSPTTRPTGWRSAARRVFAAVQPLTVRDREGDHVTLGEPRRTDLAEFDVVLLRQDPPFDLAYITTTHLLERIHPKTLVVNDPREVRNAPEKMFVMEFPDLMPPTLITRDLAEIKAFRAEHGDIVMKPLYGKGGEAVFRLAREDLNFGSLYDLFAVTFREQWVVQKFLPAVKHGDKRIILVDGEFAGAVNRVPAPDDLRSNMVRGGTPKETELTRARARDLRAPRPVAARARADLRRHRRDRRLSHRDQRDLADRHPRDQESRRAGRRGDDLGPDRGEAQESISDGPASFGRFISPPTPAPWRAASASMILRSPGLSRLPVFTSSSASSRACPSGSRSPDRRRCASPPSRTHRRARVAGLGFDDLAA